MESSNCQDPYQKAAVVAATVAQQWQVVVSTKNEIWSQQQHDYKQLQRERVPPRSHPSDGYHGVVNVPKRPPLIGKIPPLLDKMPRLLDKKQPLLARPDDGGYSKYNSHVGYRVYNESRNFSRNRRQGPYHTRHHESGYRWARYDYSTNRHPNYKGMKNSFRRKRFYSSHYSREWIPNKRQVPFFKQSPAGWKNTPLNRANYSMGSRSYFQEQNRAHFHHSPNRRKERFQSFQSSRNALCSSSSAVSSSKVLGKANRLTEKKLDEAENKWSNKVEKSEKIYEVEISKFQAQSKAIEKSENIHEVEISKFEAQSKTLVFIEQKEEPKSNIADGSEICDNNQQSIRSESIAMKTKEIEQVYRHDCETFGMVVKMLIDKDPSLEKPIQFSLKENLREIGERCLEELKHFITTLDNSPQGSERPF
ncbi:Periphilin-1 [Apodemus speciosus]|uniref:Periphilin-1 n=1 Tax=Apodemus speciosus TaxID=105296 RepID=A0ABQ0FW59_APOSI